MSFLGARRPLNGCSCERRGTGAFGLGDAATTAVAAALDPSAVMQLQAQLNRFGSSAPIGFQFVPTALPVNGVLDVNTAAPAIVILQWRYVRAAQAFPGESQDAINKLKDVTSVAATTDPVTWVAGDLSNVTSLIQKYADANGLAPALPIVISQVTNALGGMGGIALIAGAIGLAVYMGGK